MVAADDGERSADRAAFVLVFGRAAGASAGLGVAGAKRSDARGGFFPAVTPAQGGPVAFAVRRGLAHFADDGEPAVSVSWVDDMLHDPDCNQQNRHSMGATPITAITARPMTRGSEWDVTGHQRGQRGAVHARVGTDRCLLPSVTRFSARLRRAE